MYVNAKWHTNTAPTYAMYVEIPSSIYHYYISDHIYPYIYVPQFTKVNVIHCLIL